MSKYLFLASNMSVILFLLSVSNGHHLSAEGGGNLKVPDCRGAIDNASLSVFGLLVFWALAEFTVNELSHWYCDVASKLAEANWRMSI